MVMVKKQNCDVNVITDLIKYYVPSAIVESNVGKGSTDHCSFPVGLRILGNFLKIIHLE